MDCAESMTLMVFRTKRIQRVRSVCRVWREEGSNEELDGMPSVSDCSSLAVGTGDRVGPEIRSASSAWLNIPS